jgi:hypothetical protein
MNYRNFDRIVNAWMFAGILSALYAIYGRVVG